MKTWALVLVLVAATIVPVHHAEARKAPAKRKIVVISFDEKDLHQVRGPASLEDQKEAAAEARHMARLAEANVSIPEF